ASETIDDDFFVALQARADNAFAAGHRPELDWPILDRVGFSQSEHELLCLVGADRALIHQQGGMPLARRNADAGKKTGNDATICIRENGAQKNTASIRVQAIVE